jgi:hypothetical protein
MIEAKTRMNPESHGPLPAQDENVFVGEDGLKGIRDMAI